MTQKMTPELLAMHYEAETLRMLSMMDNDNVAPAMLDDDGMLYVNASLVQAILSVMTDDVEAALASEDFKSAVYLTALVAVTTMQQAYTHAKGIDIDSLDK